MGLYHRNVIKIFFNYFDPTKQTQLTRWYLSDWNQGNISSKSKTRSDELYKNNKMSIIKRKSDHKSVLAQCATYKLVLARQMKPHEHVQRNKNHKKIEPRIQQWLEWTMK